MRKRSIKLSVVGMESGAHPETGEKRYQVHFEPAVMSKEDYEVFMKKQLGSEEDVVEVFLE